MFLFRKKSKQMQNNFDTKNIKLEIEFVEKIK